MSLIRRNQRTSDETPPWEDMEFVLAVDSDQLSEELKRAYPECSKHRERKHMAAIDFLRAELHDMQAGKPTSVERRNGYLTASEAPDAQNEAFDGRSRSRSPASSSSVSNVAPKYSLRQSSVLQAATSPTTPAPPSPLRSNLAQQFVFSVVDGRPLQPKTKRCMTGEEKLAYKTTRKRGACSSCRHKKGKVCNGPEPRFETLLTFCTYSARMLVMVLRIPRSWGRLQG
jgi:hypothetical protein